MSRNVVQSYDTWTTNGNATFAYDTKVSSDLPFIASVHPQRARVSFSIVFLHDASFFFLGVTSTRVGMVAAAPKAIGAGSPLLAKF